VVGLNAVVDLSHHNGDVDFRRVAADGIVGVIHKATQGTGYVDSRYAERREQALSAGLLWGAYHFGTGDDGDAQANHFLSVVQPEPDTLVALDYEKNDQGSSMSLSGAVDFVTHVRSSMGRWPGFYRYATYLPGFGGGVYDPAILVNCWLWLAEYGPEAHVPANWREFKLWQYTDGSAGPEPHSVDGVGNCDRDTFNGDVGQLRALWGAA
jgi:lysozyme